MQYSIGFVLRASLAISLPTFKKVRTALLAQAVVHIAPYSNRSRWVCPG